MRDAFISWALAAASLVCVALAFLLLYFLGQASVLDYCDKYGAYKTDTRQYTCQRIAP